jgi:hypothetical protein
MKQLRMKSRDITALFAGAAVLTAVIVMSVFGL